MTDEKMTLDEFDEFLETELLRYHGSSYENELMTFVISLFRENRAALEAGMRWRTDALTELEAAIKIVEANHADKQIAALTKERDELKELLTELCEALKPVSESVKNEPDLGVFSDEVTFAWLRIRPLIVRARAMLEETK